jgi:hypothetical protein
MTSKSMHSASTALMTSSRRVVAKGRRTNTARRSLCPSCIRPARTMLDMDCVLVIPNERTQATLGLRSLSVGEDPNVQRHAPKWTGRRPSDSGASVNPRRSTHPPMKS